MSLYIYIYIYMSFYIYIYIYIYIYMLSSTDSFVVSQLFGVAYDKNTCLWLKLGVC